MLEILALTAAASVQPIVSGDWLQAHLNDPTVRVIDVGDGGEYSKGHVPGARLLDHMATVEMGANGHRLAANDVLARALAKAGADDGAHVVLYGDSPMATGWVVSAFAAIGHADAVSWLDGGFPTWRRDNRPVETAVPQDAHGSLTVRDDASPFVDAAWVKAHLQSPSTKLIDVRTQGEWDNGHLPNATLILWQDLFADVKLQKFKSPDEIRALLTKAGVGANQEVVTYCAVGMRASLMGWAARAVAGVPAKIYIGSWQDWSKDRANPVAK